MIYNAPKVFVLFWCCDEASGRHCVRVVLVCFGVHSPGPAKNRDNVLTTWMLHFDSESIE